MNAVLHAIATWLADLYLGATLLLVIWLVAQAALRTPAHRIAVAWCGTLGLVALVALQAAPGLKRISLAPRPAEVRIVETPTPSAPALPIEIAEPLPSETPEQATPIVAPPTRTAVTPEPAASASQQVQRPFDRVTAGVGCYLAGALLVLVWLALGAWRARRLLASSQPAPDAVAQQLAQIVGKSRIPRLLVSETIASPVALGVLRPTIVLPARWLAATDVASLRAILAHEWAHLAHGDLALVALGRGLLVAFYAHPLLWWVRGLTRRDQELRADAAAALDCGRHEYAASLVAWARLRLPAAPASLAGLSMAAEPSQLERRVGLLLDASRPLVRTSTRTWMGLSGLFACGLVALVASITLEPLATAVASEPAAQAQVSASPPSNEQPAVAQPAEPPAVCAPLEPTGKSIAITGKVRFDGERLEPAGDALVRIYRIDDGPKIHARPTGRPKMLQSFIPGAEIRADDSFRCLTNFDDPSTQRFIAETRTANDGTFTFPEMPIDKSWLEQKSRLWVCAMAPGRGTLQDRAIVSTPDNHPPTQNPLVFNLLPAAALRGRVTDVDGKPVAGAAVTCPDLDSLVVPVPGMLSAVTDADGRYEIMDLPPFDVNDVPPYVSNVGVFGMASTLVCVDHPDFARGVVEFERLPATVDLQLARPATLRGRIVDTESGEPLPKVLLQWERENGESGQVVLEEAADFVVERLQPGKYKLQARAAERRVAKQTVEIVAGENTAEFKLARGALIKGRIVSDDDGRGWSHIASTPIAVNALREGRPESEICIGYPNRDGAFTMAVEAGKNRITAFCLPPYELVDAERWRNEGVVATMDRETVIELRIRQGQEKLANDASDKKAVTEGAIVASQGNWTSWSPELLPVEPISIKALRALLRQSDVVMGEDDEESNGVITEIVFTDEYGVEPAQWLQAQTVAQLDQFPQLTTLYLFAMKDTDQVLARLRKHAGMRNFVIMEPCDVTNAGVRDAATMPNLELLCLVGDRLDDEAIRTVAGMRTLTYLVLEGRFTDEGLNALRDKHRLEGISLAPRGDGRLTDDGLQAFTTMPELVQLSLASDVSGGGWNITDVGLATLSTLTQLENLNIRSDGITDEGIQQLATLKNLERLEIAGKQITPAGLDRLRVKLPKTRIAPLPEQE